MSQDTLLHEEAVKSLQQGFNAPDGTVAGTKGPTQFIINYIWCIIVSGILLVFLGSGVGIVVSIFIGKDANSMQPLLTLFTATLGFLAGVLTPSPMMGNQDKQH